jgi:hypothetical protein
MSTWMILRVLASLTAKTKLTGYNKAGNEAIRLRLSFPLIEVISFGDAAR